MVRRLWSPEIARGLVLTYIVLGVAALGLVWSRQGNQGKRLTKVEQHVVILERTQLCSDVRSCRRLFDELLEAGRVRKRLGVREFARLHRLENRLARQLAQAHHKGVVPGRSPSSGKPGRSLLPLSVPAPLQAKEPHALLHSPPVAGKLRMSIPRSTVRNVRTGSEHLHAEVSPLLGAPKVAPGSPVRTVTGRIPSTIVAGRHIPAK